MKNIVNEPDCWRLHDLTMKNIVIVTEKRKKSGF
ncbi:hypothetical protein J2Z66_007719 [Paenibacillus eucommiae]|uniref:Uncharacterized protein n=1 Tax=Paenibacillus eucommiae TaxID=1355755 RepID=A0ABS4J8E1_9BACL|nr:hypothetical protein [Paenibacillus eucommiae]